MLKFVTLISTQSKNKHTVKCSDISHLEETANGMFKIHFIKEAVWDGTDTFYSHMVIDNGEEVRSRLMKI